VAEYDAGGSSESIGALFCLSKRSVIKILREAGIKVRYPRMTEAELRRATMLYRDGYSLLEVSKRLGSERCDGDRCSGQCSPRRLRRSCEPVAP
jgi:hypothetical protein